MLKTFKHKGLEAYFTEENRRLLNPQHIGRITFRFEDGCAFDVNLEDYH